MISPTEEQLDRMVEETKSLVGLLAGDISCFARPVVMTALGSIVAATIAASPNPDAAADQFDRQVRELVKKYKELGQ
jgi:hypothetical protein